LNLYGYADGDPVNFADPSGESPVLATALIGAAVGGYIGYRRGGWAGATIGAVGGGGMAGAGLGYAGVAAAGAVSRYLANRALTRAASASASTVGAAEVIGASGTAATVAASAKAAEKVFIPAKEVVFVAVRDGKVLNWAPAMDMSHEQWVNRVFGSISNIPANTYIVTVGKHQRQITATLSKTIHDMQTAAPFSVQEAVRGFFQ
jgi:hypothetical protein